MTLSQFLKPALIYLIPVLISEGYAASFFPQPFSTTVSDAPIIVKGKIGNHYSDWGKSEGDSKKIYTYYELLPEEVLKGSDRVNENTTLIVREMGGEKNGVGLHIEGTAQFQKGEKVVVFLKEKNSEDSFDVRGMMLGKLTVQSDSVGEIILKGPALIPSTQKWTLTDLKNLIQETDAKSVSPKTTPDALSSPRDQTSNNTKAQTTQPSASAPHLLEENSGESSPFQNRLNSIVIGGLFLMTILLLWKFFSR